MTKVVDGPTPSVIVVEDDPVVLEAVSDALRRDGFEVYGSTDGLEVREIMARSRHQLAILDIRLPMGPDGYEMARSLRTTSDIPILFLTAADSENDILAGFAAGGDDYVVKPFSMDQLLARVHALLRRSPTADTVRRAGDLVLDPGAPWVSRAGSRIALTETERAVLQVLMEHPGDVLGKRELLHRVWGHHDGNPHVVEVHVSSLRRKLEEHGPRVIQTVRGKGYVLRPQVST